MRKIKFITIITLVILSLSVALVSGCGKTAQWADPMVENVLVSVNNEDYSGFIKDFGDNLINEIPQDKFPDVISGLKGDFGKYIENSKKMFSVNISNNETTTEYNGKFENKDTVQFKFIFEKTNNQIKITGFAFK
ncbi:MAG: DUF3887 domain-containing protein [Actinobacteria bacterium]|nr:DUF3887 domain-containing protein [Actinomycetota bacterium]